MDESSRHAKTIKLLEQLCDVSEWLNAEARWDFAEWTRGKRHDIEPPRQGRHLSENAIRQVRDILSGRVYDRYDDKEWK